MKPALAAYRFLTRAAEPLTPLLLRVGAGEEPVEFHRERAARAPAARGAVWWHAASLGEVAALDPLLERARARGLAASFSVTVNTAAGRGAARERWGERAALAPLDLPGAVRRAFDLRRPRALILIETELWPNWLLAAAERGVAVGIANGRLSDRSFPRYRRLAAVFRPLMASLRAVAARTEADRDRFLELGAPPEALRVTGNAKHDRLAVAAPAALPWPASPVLTVGSLRPGEEAPVLAAFERLRARVPGLRLVLALRHPGAWDALDRDLAGRGFRPARRSRPAPGDRDADVLIVDTHGELPGLYAASSVALVGGTLVPVGGHNVLEAAMAGVPVLFGPHLGNVAEEARALLEAGAARTVGDPDELARAAASWLGDDDARRQAGARARRAAESLRGASERTLDWLVERGVLFPEAQPR